jgi:hypothetical protein
VKFTIAQLRKLSMPYQFSEDIDLSSDLNGLEDILKVSYTHVTETIYNRGDDSYRIDFTIDCNLILSDSITLEEIEYTIINNHTVELNSDDHIITRISWTKNKYNYVTGVFDAANDPNFSDAVPIAIIKDQEGSDHYVDVKVPKFYKL